MTAPGAVCFEVPRDAALHAALWILHYGNFDRDAPDWATAKRIGDRLFQSWKRNGRSRFSRTITLTLPRREVRWLARHLPGAATIIGDTDGIRENAAIVRHAALRRLVGRRGNPGLTRPRLRDGDTTAPERTYYYHKARRRKLEAEEAARKARWQRLHPLTPGGTILGAAEIPD